MTKEPSRAKDELTSYSQYRWSALASLASLPAQGPGPGIEAMRRVVAALEASEQSANTLGGRIWWLNVWLLVVTVAIAAMTIVQAAAALKVLVP